VKSRRGRAVKPAKDAQPYEFSWRWGLEGDPGHQGYHGLKAEMHDEFLALGKAGKGASYLPNTVTYEADGTAYYSTAVVAPRDLTACVKSPCETATRSGGVAPA
jgi:hypothetical protein